MKRTILWENTFPQLEIYADSNRVGSTLFDVFEFDDGLGNAYYAVGSIYFPGARQRLFVAKVNPVTGESFSGYPKIVALGISGDVAARGFAMRTIINDNIHEGYMIAGLVHESGVEKAALIKLNTSGNLDTGFGTGGYEAFSFTGYDIARFRNFKPVVEDGEITGYALTGWVGKYVSGFMQAQDLLVMHTDDTGVELWSTILDKSDLITLGYDDDSISQPPNPCNDSLTLQKDRGFDIGIASNGDFIVSAQVDHCSEIPGDWPYYEYVDCRAALLRVDAGDGTPLSATYLQRFRGLDFETPVRLAGNIAFVTGSVFDSLTETVDGALIAYDLSGEVILWQKKFLIENGGGSNNCLFDFNFSTDGGFLLCGNNEVNGDDYIIGKLRTNCHVDRTFDISNGLTISSVVGWDTDMDIKGTIRIVDGGKLTISDEAVIRFADTYALNDYNEIATGTAEYTKIVVEPGGQLISEDCTLKGLPGCDNSDSMWEGIEVWGNPAQPQNLPPGSPQGHLSASDAVIEDAVLGLLLDKKFYNADANWDAFGSFGGGIVSASNSTFLNCRRSVHFAPFDRKVIIGENTFFLNNRSSFNNTGFICGDYVANPSFFNVAYNTRLGVNVHVSMWGVRGVRFSNCEWKSTTILPQALRGSGIISDDASYFVTNTAESANFVNLHRGILARSAFDQLKQISVLGNRFQNVLLGIQTLNGAYHIIEGNEWTDIPHNFDPDHPAAYGIRLDGSTAYRITDNKLFAADSYTGAYGIITDNTLGLPSEVGYNNFNDLRIAHQTQRNNSGLQITCNQYEGSRYAWSINPETPQSGALPDQGECGTQLLQAGNRFLDPACPSPGLAQSHIYSKVAFKYSHRPISNETPTCFSTIVDVDECDEENFNDQTCAISLPCSPCETDDFPELIEEAATDKGRWYYLGLLVNMLLEEERLDEAVSYIDAEPSAVFDKLKVQALLAAQRYTEAEDALENIPSSDTAFHLLYELFITLGQESRTLRELDTAEEKTLWDVIEIGAPESNIAEAALEIALDTLFYRHTEEIPTESLRQPATLPLEQMLQSARSDDFQAFSIAPNPASEEIVLHLQVRAAHSVQIRLFNAYGHRVRVNNPAPDTGQMTMSVSDLPAGLYFCVVIIDGRPHTSPFVITR